MDNEAYYFISTGEKTYFYTLNYTYLEPVYKQNCNFQWMIADYERKYEYICNLSHDFDEAILKAKSIVESYRGDAKLVIPSSPTDMNEREKNDIEKTKKIVDEGVLLTGKYANTHISNVPLEYMAWVVANQSKSNTLYLICEKYLIDNNYIQTWMNDLANKINNKNNEKINVDLINSKMFRVGKFSGESFNDIAFTKKGELKKSFLDYYNFMKSNIKEIIKCAIDFDDNDDYHICLNLTSDLLKGHLKNDGILTDYILTLLTMYVEMQRYRGKRVEVTYTQSYKVVSAYDACIAKIKKEI